MKHIVVVYGASSAILYVQEAIARGYKPIVVNPPVAHDFQEENFQLAVGDKAIYIKAKSMDDQSDVIEELKKYDIACIVPGAAGGVKYAEKLIDAMGFEGNGYDSLWRRDTKEGMHQTLKEAGLRYIRGVVVTKEQDIIDFFRDNNIRIAFMKPSEGASSIGGKKCHSPEEAIEHYRYLKEANNAFGWKSDVLLQEFIDGTEYIVDSVSCEGKHLITDIWVYNKILNKDDNVIYDSTELMLNIEPGMHDLIKYAYKVLDATGFKIGPCHGEYKIDEKGPVLMETNPRPMGASLTKEYLDEALGHHMTDIALDAYLDKQKFYMRMNDFYRPRKMAAIKFIISPKEMDANMMPILEILKCLKSFRYTNPMIKNEVVHMQKTVDLDTSPLMIKLCHNDPNVVRHECNFLHRLETDYFDLLFAVDDKIPFTPLANDYGWLTTIAQDDIKVMVCSNEGKSVYQYGRMTKVPEDTWDTFDGVLIEDTRAGTLGEKIRLLRREASQVMNGGFITVVPEFFENFPYKAVSVEIILRILGFTVEVPVAKFKNIMTATKD